MKYLEKMRSGNLLIYVRFALIALSLNAGLSCMPDKSENNYLTISGEISNMNEDSLVVFNFNNDSKSIKIEKDGTFKDTLKITEQGILFLNYNSQQFRTYARNGLNIHLSWDAEDIFTTVKFSGNDREVLEYFNEIYYRENPFSEVDLDVDSVLYFKQIDKYYSEVISNMPHIDTAFVRFFSDIIKEDNEWMKDNYREMRYFESLKGKISPEFTNFESSSGKLVSLKDFRGKYVYIDFWATWCTPCRQEIPYLKKLKEEYKGKNIEFVGISIDNASHKQKWIDMVNDKGLTGSQLIAPNAGDTEFIHYYRVTGIPSFILIDPEGKVVEPRAPRPSYEKEIKELLSNCQL